MRTARYLPPGWTSPRALGLALQHARKRLGLRQEDAAKSLGVARTTLVAIEQGARRLSRKDFERLCALYAEDKEAGLVLEAEAPHASVTDCQAMQVQQWLTCAQRVRKLSHAALALELSSMRRAGHGLTAYQYEVLTEASLRLEALAQASHTCEKEA